MVLDILAAGRDPVELYSMAAQQVCRAMCMLFISQSFTLMSN